MNMHFHLFVGQKAGIATCAYVLRRLVVGVGDLKTKIITGRGIKTTSTTLPPNTITYLKNEDDHKIKRNYGNMHIHVVHLDK